MVHRLLVPIGSSELSGRAAEARLELARLFAAWVTGFVIEPPAPLPGMASHAARCARETDEHLARTRLPRVAQH